MTDDSSDAREQQIRRAREVLSDAGWLFDDFVNAEMRKVLLSQPDEREAREEAWRRARVATEMKAGLESLIESCEADARLKERREQQRRI
jgi:SH3-like domain-containing protein